MAAREAPRPDRPAGGGRTHEVTADQAAALSCRPAISG